MTGIEAATAADVCVAVVNYNTRELLARCLATVLSEGATDVVVVDNASTDGSAPYVRDRFRGVCVIENDINVGYGAAANQAVWHTSKPFVLLLNADTELQPGCVAELVTQAGRSPRAGIVAPAIMTSWGNRECSYFPFPGTLDWLLENEPLAPLVKRLPPLKRRSVSFQPADEHRRVPWVMGCAVLLRREAMESVRGFDESYFMYYEEVDLCRRMEQAGWEVHFTPAAQVTHVGGASTSQHRTEMLIRHFQSTLHYYSKYYSGPRLGFWLTAMHVKRMALLARDSVRLLKETDPVERRILQDQRKAWLATAIRTPPNGRPVGRQ
jgi:N-acetylglucosaminyl-diphospho-decaprenol L-rhamnosyltransferase